MKIQETAKNLNKQMNVQDNYITHLNIRIATLYSEEHDNKTICTAETNLLWKLDESYPFMI